MKFLLQQVVISFIALYFTMMLFPGGLVVKNGFSGLLYASVLVVLGFVIVRPVLNVVALPLNIITLGLFSIVTTIAVIFLIALVDKNFIIQAFTFNGLSLYALRIPSFNLNIFLSYLLISVTIQLVQKIMIFIFDL